MHLRYIHLMRGAAIILVVAIHCILALEWIKSDWKHELVNIIFWDGSGVFFAVAGYLFHHLSPKFSYKDYLVKKFTNVILPFLLISIPGIIHTLGYLDIPNKYPELLDLPTWMHVVYLYAYPGQQYNYPLWFIPVMSMYFLMAPIFIWLFKRPIWFFASLILFALYTMGHFRPSAKYQHIVTTVYWLSSYMVGMAASMYREQLGAWLDRHPVIPWAAWLAVVLIQLWVLGDGNPKRLDVPHSATEIALNLYFVQKTLLFVAFIALFRRIQHRPLVALDMLANWSFPIFFLHAYILQLLFKSRFGFEVPGSVGGALIVTVVVTGVTMGLAMLIRKVVGKRSRYVIGY
jgi:probable poly-beta-1,6-N-acetyl-D-glucosamine export protein